ncbi:hypothetical protein [Bdellovibrio sp. HCB337]|uniref:hypothetical protein n=1 Tax=Bdellovibrio sp. HCB337 TaxID=3394358 RepID=UPI0039A610B9
MRNLLIALTSFFATVLILTQVALADINVPLDPSHTTAATNPDPNPSSADESGKNITGSVANAGHDCINGQCFGRNVHGDLERGHMPKCADGNKASCVKGTGGTSSGSGKSNSSEGAQ